MTLTFQAQTRVETDATIITNLQRKGWVQNDPPSYNAATQHAPQWNGSEWVTVDKTADEIAAESRRIWAPREFRARFTDDELLAFLTACKASAALDLLRFKLTTVQEVVSDNAELLAAMEALVQAGILTEQRKAEILP